MGKQVKTPRFYVDMVTFLHATGQTGWDDGSGGAELLYMNPSNPYTKEIDPSASNEVVAIGNADNNTIKTSFPVNFCALLNHNLGSNTNSFKFYGKHGLTSSTTSVIFSPEDEILNSYHSTTFINPTYNGTTIFDFTSDDEYWRSFSIFYDTDNPINAGTHQIGSFVVGKYWDAPNSPDLSLTMSRRFDGIKKQKTIGGKTLANIYYDGPTEWTMNNPREENPYKYPPFELDLASSIYVEEEGDIETKFNQIAKSGLGRKGLRSWKLTFSYISEDNMWTDYESSTTSPFDDSGYNAEIDGDAPIDPSQRSNPMLSDDSFNFVWNCTLGGTLPFIFQPDNTNNNPDQFSICTFRDNTLSVKQVAFNTYSLSITIDEVA